jgi:GntR family transcriptional repressor for pyruvate dehydrogenase complex
VNLPPVQSHKRSLVEQVCHRLCEAIRKDNPESDLLPAERDLAARFGVSRPVVREAVKRLELQGLVEVKHGIGTRIVNRLHAPLSGSIALLVSDAHHRLDQAMEVRAAIEPEVARLAAERATPAARKRLRAVHRRLQEAQDLPAAIEADMAFHRTLAQACGNDIFTLVLDSMADLGRASRQTTISTAGVKVAERHHARILDAVLRGDAQEAKAAMRDHIQAAAADLMRGHTRRKAAS